jgi:tryptophan 2,3-dioxygenase
LSDLTYSRYLKLDQILAAQAPRSEPVEHDEMLFIVIHQVYELWFKLVLHEIDRCKQEFSAGDLFGAIARFKRLRTILKTLVGQLDILETMTPMSFLAFRDRLESSSGFQSAQFRAVEFALGMKREAMVAHYAAEGELHAEVVKRLEERSLVDHFYDFLEQRGVAIPPVLRTKPRSAPTEANEEVQAALVRLFKEHPDVAILLELMTDFDEGLQEWRYRHVKMVERTIGNKKGTGGSTGAEYLRATLFRPIFPDLWAIRQQL